MKMIKCTLFLREVIMPLHNSLMCINANLGKRRFSFLTIKWIFTLQTNSLGGGPFKSAFRVTVLSGQVCPVSSKSEDSCRPSTPSLWLGTGMDSLLSLGVPAPFLLVPRSALLSLSLLVSRKSSKPFLREVCCRYTSPVHHLRAHFVLRGASTSSFFSPGANLSGVKPSRDLPEEPSCGCRASVGSTAEGALPASSGVVIGVSCWQDSY